MDRTIPGGFWFYIADVDHLSETRPAVHEEFIPENHSVSRSTQPFAQVWTDMALEQSINLDSKTTGGITNISQRPEALAHGFLTCHERAAITTVMPCCCTLMCEINNIIMRHMTLCALLSWYTQRGSTETDVER